MENLFDFLEYKTNKENKKTEIDNKKKKDIKVEETIYIIDEKHMKYLEELRRQLFSEDEEISSEYDKKDIIRLNSYVGSRMNTDLRSKNKPKISIDKSNDLESILESTTNVNATELEFDFEEVEMYENIFDKVLEDKLLIVDGSSLLSTSFYATARDLLFAKTEEQKQFAYTKLMKSFDGQYTNGVYMFFKTLLPLIKDQKITHLAVVLDRSRNTFRREIDPEYKANRSETPPPLKSQFKLLTEILSDINIAIFSHEDYEADDFAGSIVKKFEKDIQIYLHTKDEDYIQLVSDYTKLWMVTGKADDMYKEIGINKKELNLPSGVFEYTPNLVKHFKGIEPIQIIDAKAIEGDKSDNIKGVKNVGITSSRPLIAHYGSLEEIYRNIEDLNKDEEKEINTFFKESLGIKRSPLKNLLLYKEDAIKSKILATIKTDIDEIQELNLDKLKLNIDYEKMNEIFKNLGMNSLIK